MPNGEARANPDAKTCGKEAGSAREASKITHSFDPDPLYHALVREQSPGGVVLPLLTHLEAAPFRFLCDVIRQFAHVLLILGRKICNRVLELLWCLSIKSSCLRQQTR